jgi:hypothetical protein
LPSIAPIAGLMAVWLAQRQADAAIRKTLIGGVIFTAALSIAAVAYVQFTDEHKKISSLALIQSWTSQAQANEPLYFYLWFPQSTKFYTAGQARLLKDIPEIEQLADSGEPVFIALYSTQMRSIPPSLLARMTELQKFGRYTLFEMNRRN